MVKKLTTISIDLRIKQKSKKIIRDKLNMSFSRWIEQSLRKLIRNYEKEVKK